MLLGSSSRRAESDERAPITETDDPNAAAHFIAQAIAWNFWPKMIPLRGAGPAVTSALSVDGSIELPDPDQHPRLQLFDPRSAR